MKIEMLDYDFTVCKVTNYTQTDLDAPFVFIRKNRRRKLACVHNR